MHALSWWVEASMFAILLIMSLMALSVALERWRFYRRIDVLRYQSRARLEHDLTRHLTIIGSIAANAPYIGLLGTVLGIMTTFWTMGQSGEMDVQSIMIGLSLALKATAAGIAVAIPCVLTNNALIRMVANQLARYDEAHGA